MLIFLEKLVRIGSLKCFLNTRHSFFILGNRLGTWIVLIMKKVVLIPPLEVGKPDKLHNKFCCPILGQPLQTNVLVVLTLDGIVFACNVSFAKDALSQAIVSLCINLT